MEQTVALLTAAQDSASQMAILAVNMPDPGEPQAPPGVGGAFNDFLSWFKWVALGVCIAALIGVGVKMAVSGHRRGEGGESVGALGWVLGGVCVIAAAVALVGFIYTAGSAEEEASSGAQSGSLVVAAAQVQNDG